MADTKEMIAAGQTAGVIHCLTIPLHNETALLPNAAVAEVVAYKEPESVTDAPEWLLGYFEWREKKVPLISFEAISGRDIQPAKKNSRIAILNTLNANTQLPYVAVLSQGIPSLAVVQENGLEDREVDDSRHVIAAVVELGGTEAIVPNIDEIEQRLLKLSV